MSARQSRPGPVDSEASPPVQPTQPVDPNRSARPGPLAVSHSVIVDMVRLAALEVPGVLKVGRGGPLARLGGSPVRASVGDGKVSVRVWIIARPDYALTPLAVQVRQAVGATVERLLGMEIGEVTVVIDGVRGRGK
jgi:uncharacterized alkaline shock family protein YloU